MHPLDGARLKFKRGSEHVDTLNEEIRRFLQEDAHRILEKYEPQVGGYVRWVLGEPPREKWSILLGEIAHNFRSCLDHVAWQLAIAGSPTGNPEDHWKASDVSFPIYADRRKYLRKRHRIWRHRGLLPAHRWTLRHLQPYQRRHAPESHPLWHLHWLSNIDKHQVLHTAFVGLDETAPPLGHFAQKRVDPETGEVLEYIYGPPSPGIEMEVVARVGGPSEADVYLKGDLPFQVAIDQYGTVLHEQPVLRLVDGIRIEVGVVLDAFTPLL